MLSVLSLTILAACTSTPTTVVNRLPPAPAQAAPSTTSTPKGLFVPCSQDSVITYNAPDPDHPIAETAANVYDTPQTISQIRKHNSAYREACK